MPSHCRNGTVRWHFCEKHWHSYEDYAIISSSINISKVRGYLKKGCAQKEAIVRATDECINKGILKDVLVKHRAEVVDMFLTTFDKKMYKEALLEEGERNKLISQVQKKLEKGHSAEKIADDLVEGLSVIQEIINELQR